MKDALILFYKDWIDFLDSLLPLFHGIQYIEHKNYIIAKMNQIKGSIKSEEISNIIHG